MKITDCKIFFSFSIIIFLLGLQSETFGQKVSKHKITQPSQPKKQTKDDRRKEVEQLLLKGEYEHDGSIELIDIGTIDSVPALLKVLKNHPPFVKKESIGISPQLDLEKADLTKLPSKPKENKIYICTYAHAVSALHKITGQTFIDYEDWKTWWENYQKEISVKKN